MIILSFFRVIKFSFQDIGRNIWLSIVTVTILILALFSVNILLTVNVISDAAIAAIKERIDVNIYLKQDAQESQIKALQSQISNIEQVKKVSYISKAQALETFKQKHQNNPDVIESLRELGKNPLTPSLVIKPTKVDEYDTLIANLNKIDNPIIESKNFDDHKLMIDKINGVTDRVSEIGLLVSGIFIFITLLLVYNAIRVAIYTHRRAIKIMRLVGASNWFIRAPYLFSSIIYTTVGIIAIIAVFYFFITLLQPYIETFFIDYDINLVRYFNNHFITIFGTQFLVAVVVNMLASLIAVGKYSKV